MNLLWNMGMILLAFVFLSCEKDDRLNPNDNQNTNTTSASPNSDTSDTTNANNEPATIKVTVTNFKSTKGQLLLGLYSNAADFPEKDRTYAARIVEVNSKNVTVEMDGIEAGSYALSVHHDENENDKIDQNFVGIPQEGFGFSNNASGTFGPPKFENAKFQVNNGKTQQLSIELQHY